MGPSQKLKIYLSVGEVLTSIDDSLYGFPVVDFIGLTSLVVMTSCVQCLWFKPHLPLPHYLPIKKTLVSFLFAVISRFCWFY